MSAIANVTAYVDAADHFVQNVTKGLSGELLVDRRIDVAGEYADLQLTDLRALLARLAELCPDHGSCETCETVLCARCDVGELPHEQFDDRILCSDCDITARAYAEEYHGPFAHIFDRAI